MADNFFGFDTKFPSGLGILGKPGLDGEFLTADVEEDYDALNDETFGHASNDDWEEAHEKLSELIKNNNIDIKSIFHNDSLLDNDISQEDIVNRSISQLGLEDDLDDPAIMTISRNSNSTHRLGSVFGPSPPPPAILETEICGSPKTHSIWSTTPKDSGISFLHSLSSSFLPDHLAHSNSSSDNVFISPKKIFRAEDLEKDLLSSSSKEQPQVSNNSWQRPPEFSSPSPNLPNTSPSPHIASLNQEPKKAPVRMLTREEVERHLHADSKMSYQKNFYPNKPPIVIRAGIPMPPSVQPPLRGRGPVIGNNSVPERPYLPYPPYYLNPQQAQMMPNLPNRPPIQRLIDNYVTDVMEYYARMRANAVAHPFMHKQYQFPVAVPNKQFENEYYDMQNVEDEYAGLMSKKEKDWLIRIQMWLLKFDNPYVEDYYYTTMVERKAIKKYSENSQKSGDAPQIILPDTKVESKTYVPTQFEGSLGKLQAVSVNFPRKVLDIKVTRSLEDEEGRVVTNQSLMKFRRLLIDIEKLYTNFLEIEDEERRILAKPDSHAFSHRSNISGLKTKIYDGLCGENTSEDNFQNIMTIRKGRNFLVRSFPLFSEEQQLQCLICLCHCLSLILKKDLNDLVLEKNYSVFTDSIQKYSLSNLILVCEALEHCPSSESTKEKNIVAAFKSKFGSSVICSMLMKAEKLYSENKELETDSQAKWAKCVLHLVDCLCSVPNSALSPSLSPCCNLLNHFQRFAVDRDKFEVLKERLIVLESHSEDSVQQA